MSMSWAHTPSIMTAHAILPGSSRHPESDGGGWKRPDKSGEPPLFSPDPADDRPPEQQDAKGDAPIASTADEVEGLRPGNPHKADRHRRNHERAKHEKTSPRCLDAPTRCHIHFSFHNPNQTILISIQPCAKREMLVCP